MAIVRMPIDFAVKSSEYIARQLEGATCKNWYGTVSEKGEFQLPLFPFPGSELWSDDNSAAPVRQLYSLNGILYGVVGNEFRIYSDFGGYHVAGKLNTTLGRISIIANDTQILIDDFQNGYIYQLVETSTRTAKSFFRIENATTFISAPVFTGRGSDTHELTIEGSYTGDVSRQYKVQIDGSTSPYISSVVFIGSGVNDMTAFGVYSATQTKLYKIEIDGSAGGIDTFKWSDSNGAAWNAINVPIAGISQSLNNGISVLFAHIGTHTIGNAWTFTAYPAASNDTFRWSQDGGTTWIAQNIVITGGLQLLNNGIQIKFLHLAGHTKEDFWTFDTTTDSAFYPPLIPTYLDTYGVFLKQNSRRFYLTKQDDFSQINAMTFAEANAWPDNLVAGIMLNQELILLCEKSIEFWYDVGAATFPFLRRPNLLVPYGCVAPYSLAMGAQNILFWLGQNANGGRVVLAMAGYQVTVISDEPLHQKLQEYKNIHRAYGFIIGWQGHVFYFLTFPDDDVTWVYDLSTKRWSQRTTRRKPENISTDEYIEGRYLANCHVYHNGEHYVGDWRGGKIYKLSQNYYKDGTEPIICEITTSPLHVNLNRLSIYSLQIVFQAATATEYGEGSEPTIMLQHSKTGTYNWSKELRRGIGKTGEYQRRIKWNKLGTARNRVFKIRNSDPVYRVLLGGVADLEDVGS